MVPVRPALSVAVLLSAWLTSSPHACAQVSFPIVAGQPAESRTERVLATRTSLTLHAATVTAFAEQLRQQYAIDILIDGKALDDVGLDVDSPLPSVQLESVLLEEAVDMVLGGLELTFVVRDEVLIITTPEEADSQLDTRVYPVGDLVSIPSTRRWNAEDFYGDDYDTLINVMTSTLTPDSWEDVGGAGSIEEFPASRSLVISATRDVHRQVAGLLGALRSARRVSFPGSYREDTRRLKFQTCRPYSGSSRSGQRLATGVDRRPIYQPQGAWHVPARFD